MCKFKSAIILKDRIYINEEDSHTKLLEQLNIEDTKKNAENLFVRAELIPSYNNIESDISEWKFIVDQDILPTWFVREYEEQRMKNAVVEYLNPILKWFYGGAQVQIKEWDDMLMEFGLNQWGNIACKSGFLEDMKYLCGNIIKVNKYVDCIIFRTGDDKWAISIDMCKPVTQ